jgi:hypothetical protein
MPLKDHPTAVAKQAIKVGEVLEISPAFVLHRNSVIDTALGTIMLLLGTLECQTASRYERSACQWGIATAIPRRGKNEWK